MFRISQSVIRIGLSLILSAASFLPGLQAQEVIGFIRSPIYAVEFGSPFVIDRDRLVVTNYGSGYNEILLFENENGEWNYVTAVGRSAFDQFGHAIDIHNNWLIASDRGNFSLEGEIPYSVQFYELENNEWQFRKLFWRDFSAFGESVTIHNNWAAAGDPENNLVNIYRIDGDSVYAHQEIAFDDTTNVSGNPRFGDNLLLRDDYLIAMASNWQGEGVGTKSGAVYIYKRQTDESWELLHKITVDDLQAGDGGPNGEPFIEYSLLRNFDFENSMLVLNFIKVLSDESAFAHLKIIGIDDFAWQESDSIEIANTNYSRNHDIDLRGDGLIVSDPGSRASAGDIHIFRKSGMRWIKASTYQNPESNDRIGRSLSFDESASFIYASSDNPDGGEIRIIGIKKTAITAVSQGQSGSYVKINWENFSQVQDGFKIYRDGTEIATTSGNARTYFDYEGIPGRMHTYGVTAYDPVTTLESVPDTAAGYKQPSGEVKGVVQTPLGAGVSDVRVDLMPQGVTMDRALAIDSSANAVTLSNFTEFPDTAFTISFWLKTLSDSAITVFDFTTQDYNSALRISNPSSATIDINNRALNTGVDFADGAWHHLAFTWRSTDGSISLLKDGVAVFKDKYLAGEVIGREGRLTLGFDYNDTQNSLYRGLLDEVAIWNTMREDSLIAAEMRSQPVGDEKNLISYYGFDDPQRFPQYLVPDMVWKRTQHGTALNLNFEDNPEEVIAMRRSVYTDASGRFSFENVYYDASRTFRLMPFKSDHGFAPGFDNITLSLDSPRLSGIAFDDTTSFTVSGRVFYSASDCNLAGAELVLNGQPTGVFTDSNGNYQLTVEEAGTYQLEVAFADTALSHRFRPSTYNLDVNDNLFNVDFADITISTLSGRVGAACNTSIGKATLQITSLGNPQGCYTQTIETDENGNYSIDLPSQKYLISVEDIEPANPVILQSFSSVTTDLTFQDSLVNFVYRDPLTIKIDGLPEICSGADGPFKVPVVKQFDRYFLTVRVLESYNGDTCLVDTGSVTLFDEVGGDGSDPVTIPVSNGQASFILAPGEPNILDGGDHPFQKRLSIRADIDGDRTTLDQWMIVTGHRPRSETFVTKTPELPLMILRDPPGDNSFAYFEKDSTYASNFTMSHEIGGAAGVYTDIKIGAGIPVPFTGIVIGARTHIEGQILAGRNNNNGTTVTTYTSNTERFSTSDDDNITGEKGDVFIGASFNMIYALTDVIDFDENTCSVVRDTQLVWGSEEINTSYIYTESHIRNTLLPQLRQLRTLATPDSAEILGSYIDVWEQVLVKNDRLKKRAKKERNISFSAGATREYSSTQREDSTLHIDYTTFIDSEVKVGVGIGDGDFSDVEIGVAAKFRWSKTVIEEETFGSSTTVGYVLSDNDEGDFFSVDVKEDKVYKTPVFDLVSGRSSCPWEPGSQPRDGVQLQISSNEVNDVPPEERAAFTLFLGNTSQSDETRTYNLSVIQSSNLDGAIISVGGVVIEDALSYTIPAGEQINATLAIERGPLAYDYENLQVRLYAPCDPSIADTVTFSVRYTSPCSNVNIFRPENGWLVNADDNDTLQVILNDYDASDPNLENISLQYRRKGDSWKTAFLIAKSNLPQEYITRYWDVSALPNGEYELRGVAKCGDVGISYSEISAGTIDRSGLVVFGKPQPADGILNLGEDISVSFTEDLDCDALEENMARIRDADGNVLAIETACSEKTLILSPLDDLSAFEGQTLSATVSNVKDVNGNVLTKAVNWSFTINQNPLYWSVANSALTIYEGEQTSLNGTLVNAGGQSESFTIVSMPPWVSTSTISGSVPPSGEQNIEFIVDGNLSRDTYVDSVIAQTANGDEIFLMEINVLARPPQWNVNPAQFAYSMNITAQLNIDGQASDDPFDVVSAFSGNEVRGKANVQYVSDLFGYMAFITVYSNNLSGETVTFRGWDASEGDEYGAVEETLVFENGATVGDVSNPLILNPAGVAQTTELDAGWTWIALNVENSDMSVNAVMEGVPATEGDIIKTQNAFAEYINGAGWVGSLTTLRTGTAYQTRMQQSGALDFIGRRINPGNTDVTVRQGWNWIGYTDNRNRPVNEALHNFPVRDGDILKSRDAFAQYDQASGNWLGSLEAMEAGGGYLLRSGIASVSTFGLEKPAKSLSPDDAREGDAVNWQVNPALYEYNMALVAEQRFDSKSPLDSLDRMAAFVGDECRGTARPVFVEGLNRYVVFLTLFSNETDGEELDLKLLESETGIVYAAGQVEFAPDSVLGSVLAPQRINSTYATNEGALPTVFRIYQNYPNPFNPVTTIRYELPRSSKVKLTVFNILGKTIRVLVNGNQNAGRYRVDFDARELGLGSGLYFYRFESDGLNTTRKMLLLK